MPEQTSEAFTGMNTKKVLEKPHRQCEHGDISETFPIACALDEKKPERLYIMSGINGQGYGKFSISENYGETFIHKKSR